MHAPPSDGRPPYDEAAHAAVGQLIREHRGGQAAEILESRAPHTAEQQILHQLGRAALCDANEDALGGRAHCVRALRLAGRGHPLRQDARRYLVLFLIRLGDLRRAERETLRALADVHNTGDERRVAPRLLRQLGLIHRQRGRLGDAIEFYERALKASSDPPGSYFSCTTRGNIAMALMHRGESARAIALVDAVEAASSPESGIPTVDIMRARIALENGDLLALDRHIAATRRNPGVVGTQRLSLCVDMYEAESLVQHGRAAEAVPLLEGALRGAQHFAPSGDMVAEAARRLAFALFTLGRYDEALAHCETGIRAGRRSDYLEWAASLRVAGQCLAALGDLPRARGRLSEALSIHEVTEFLPERRRLEQVLDALGWSPSRPIEPSRPSSWSRQATTCTRLSDGRFLLTDDTELCEAIRRAAATRLPVLIEGETGTGKDLVARLIHESGPDPSSPFAIVDCASVPTDLAEAELFGSVRGAYTGSVRDRRGVVEAADGGTLFLDELPSLSLALQAKLLRVMQDGTFRRVGDDRLRRARFRIIAATNREVASLVASGALKADLFFRLNGHRLRLRPLREQPQLVPALAEAFARDAGLTGIRPEAARKLSTWPWPGNVRELELLVRVAASSVLPRSMLEEADLPEAMRRSEPGAIRPDPLRSSRLEAERETLRRLLERNDGNVAATSRELGRSRQAIYKALRRAGIRPRDLR